jgi:plasmid stabilization system protein ParE
MSRRLRISAQVERDVDEIFDWIASRSRVGARRWYEHYRLVVGELVRVGGNCPTAPEADALGLPLREQLFHTPRGRTYRVVFLIDDETVDVLAVRGAGQDFLTVEDLSFPE